MLQSIERYFKQAIVDKNPQVSSAALVSALHLMKDNHEIVKRWVNEVQQALSGKSNMVQYHALGLLYHIKQKDRLAIAKLVTNQMRGSALRSPYALCLLIRYASQVLEADSSGDNGMFEFLEGCLRNKSEMVIYEAARAIVNLPNVTARELAPAVSVLQLFLTSPKATLRFAAVRTLNKVAMIHPTSLKTCNLDMENLITDSNRSIATLAITTLLKTGNESSVDRLMKQITSFLSEISDEFKIVVVNAIKSLCLKFPKKHGVMMGFLAGVLRDEGGFEYKKVVVDTIVEIITHVAEAKEAGLEHLCEFIEDCEFTTLLVRVLHILGEQGPSAENPRKYIRFVYNRLILENATVRAASVAALARFGTQVDVLRPSVLVLLKRCLADVDDEVRDRATFYTAMVEDCKPALVSKYVVNALPVSIKALERSLCDYNASSGDTPFDMRGVALATADKPKAAIGEGADYDDFSVPAPAPTVTVDQYRNQLAEISEFEDFGTLFKTTEEVQLTESETEYKVTCVKHIYQNVEEDSQHIVFQFNMTNTLNDQILENVRVLLDEIDESDCILVPAAQMAYDVPCVAYTAIALDSQDTDQTYTCNLDFIVKDCDPETGDVDDEGYPDSYALEDLDVSMADMMQPVDKPNFGAAWEELSDAHSAEETYELSSMTGIEDAVTKISAHLGMRACEKSDKVKSGKSTHSLYLAGVYAGGHEVLARARLAYDEGVTLQLAVRSSDEEVCALVSSAVG
jgi:coatomer protein complex subunit gamma